MSVQQRQALEYLRLHLSYWASLNDALEHIQKVLGVDRASAWTELIKAINARKLAARWLDQSGEDDAPTRAVWLQENTIRPDGGGEVLHQVASLVAIQDGQDVHREKRVSEPIYRALLVDRASLLALWQPPSVQDERPEAASLPVKRASAERILEVARKLYEERRGDPPNMAEAEQLVRKRHPGASRDPIREVLNRSEFQKQRRRPGVRRRR